MENVPRTMTSGRRLITDRMSSKSSEVAKTKHYIEEDLDWKTTYLSSSVCCYMLVSKNAEFSFVIEKEK